MAAVKPIVITGRLGRWSLFAGMVLVAMAAPVSAQQRPTVEQILQFKPRQPGVDITTPTKEEYSQCEVKLETGSGNSSGWVLLDSKKQLVRRFFDTVGKKGIDLFSYYKDGVEVYREIDSKNKNKPDQYRWLNSGGSKWGVDLNDDGVIDNWRTISSEEVAQEVYLAAVSRDFSRLKVLYINEAELTSLKLSAAHTARVHDAKEKAQAKFQELCSKAANLTPQAQFIRVESAVPFCVPADAKGPAQDIHRFPSRAILYQGVNKTHEWLHTGEMIQVGQAWRLTGSPSISDMEVIEEGGTGSEGGKLKVANSDPALTKLMDALMALDKNAPPPAASVGKFPAVAKYNADRVVILEQIYAKATDDKEKETWMRQILDNLCSGHQANEGDNTMLKRLADYKTQLVSRMPGSSIAGYAYYRELWARYAAELHHSTDPAKTQQAWTDELGKFVAAYPKAEDAPDALRLLAMNAEFGPKDKQTEAKKYYGLIVSNFPDNPLTPLAKGAIRRLDLNGKTMELTGPTLQGSNFDVARLKGKVVVVYYYSSSVNTSVGEFAMLKQLHTAHASKGLEIVTVSLDETQAAASGFLTSNPLPGTHLFQATDQARGLDSPLAIQYGIVGLPTIFLVGKDGKVIDRSLQMNELEEAVKKAL